MYYPDREQFQNEVSTRHKTRKEALYLCLRKDILNLTVLKEDRLPSIRQLSEYLSISRTTIQAAYDQLLFEGLIESKERSGYFVLAEVQKQGETLVQRQKQPGEQTDAKMDGQISEKNPLSPCLYDFTGAGIHPHLIDLDMWKTAVRFALHENQTYLKYGETTGELRLRKALAQHLQKNRGIVCEAEQIYISSGTQSLFERVLQYLQAHEPDQTSQICSETARVDIHSYFYPPAFKQALQVLKRQRLPYSFLKPAEKPEETVCLPKLSTNHHGWTLLYLQSQRLSLGTSSLAYNNRLKLESWLKKNPKHILIEDDYNGELQNCLCPVKPLAANRDSSIWYLGSVSKTLLPSVRLSYLVVPRQNLNQFNTYFSKDHCTASVLEQYALAHLIESGQWERHLRRLRHYFATLAQLVQSLVLRLSLPLKTWRFEETAMLLTLDFIYPPAKENKALKYKKYPQVSEIEKKLQAWGISLMNCTFKEEEKQGIFTFYLHLSSVDQKQVQGGLERLAQFWASL